MEIKYIKTMDFLFKNVIIINCNNMDEFKNKIKGNEVIEINNAGDIEYINSSYIMYWG